MTALITMFSTVSNKVVSDDGLYKLVTAINGFNLTYNDSAWYSGIYQCSVSLFDGDYVGNEYVTDKGKIAKRVQRYLSKRFINKMTADQLSHLGNIASIHTIDRGHYKIVIDSDLDIWSHARQSADHDSRDSLGLSTCYREGHQWGWCIPAMVDDENFAVVLVYDGDGVLISRAWCYMPDASTYVIYNHYGRLSLLKVSNMMADCLSADDGNHIASDIRIESDAYINSTARKVCHLSSAYKDADSIEFLTDGDYGNVCHDCDCHMSEDNTYYIDDGDYHVCEGCYSDSYTYCEGCDRTYYYDSMRMVDGDFMRCEGCISDDGNIIICDSCGDAVTDGVYLNDHECGYCQDCVDRIDYGVCDSCGDAVENYAIVDGDSYCDYCSPDYRCCDSCGDNTTTSTVIWHSATDDAIICGSCRDDDDIIICGSCDSHSMIDDDNHQCFSCGQSYAIGVIR